VLRADDTVLVVIDIQGRLAQMMEKKETLFKNQRLMIQGASALELPILLTEQYPQGMGGTIPEIAELLDGIEPIAKKAFSCCGESNFNSALKDVGRHQVLLIGIDRCGLLTQCRQPEDWVGKNPRCRWHDHVRGDCTLRVDARG